MDPSNSLKKKSLNSVNGRTGTWRPAEGSSIDLLRGGRTIGGGARALLLTAVFAGLIVAPGAASWVLGQPAATAGSSESRDVAGSPRSGDGAGASTTAALLAPPNDTCSGAESIPSSGPFPYLTTVADFSTATS